jgi:uncharacterized repeat protein (TIGR01451 family)
MLVKNIVASVALVVALIPSAALASAHVVLADSVATIEAHNGALVAAPLAGPAKPGQRLRYTIVAKNTGDQAAAKLAPSTKIPAGERFVDGSAGVSAEFSLDGGKTWSPAPMVPVTNPDGTKTQRKALPAEYNAIRWLAPAPLAPGARMTFAYDIIVE